MDASQHDLEDALHFLQWEADLPAPGTVTQESLLQLLSEHIEEMINKDFEKLVRLLYRLDVSEQVLKSELKKDISSTSSMTIARLILERQLQKIKSRRSFRSDRKDEMNDGDAERW